MCGSLLAVESANIVGYINVENDVSGYMQRGGTFITVGGGADTYDIQNIVPQKPANAATDLDDAGSFIQEIDDYGKKTSAELVSSPQPPAWVNPTACAVLRIP